MFTGIIESLGKVISIETKGSNKTFWIESPVSQELKIDQSIAHNGVCLTVEEITGPGTPVSNPSVPRTPGPNPSAAPGAPATVAAEAPTAAHRVTAIEETLNKTNLNNWQPGDLINLERCLEMNGRLDGHIVQGHADATAVCLERRELDGSWEFRFEFPPAFSHLVIEKGSISLNGISLTIFNVTATAFDIAVIPYTFQHTNIRSVFPGSRVNLEFDLIGKYVTRFMRVNNTI
jgi:riboflavin synthase